MTMKIILRQRTTRLWLKACGRWEPNSVNAQEFATGEDAIRRSNASHLPDVQICFRFDDPNLNFELHEQRLDEAENARAAAVSPKRV